MPENFVQAGQREVMYENQAILLEQIADYEEKIVQLKSEKQDDAAGPMIMMQLRAKKDLAELQERIKGLEVSSEGETTKGVWPNIRKYLNRKKN